MDASRAASSRPWQLPQACPQSTQEWSRQWPEGRARVLLLPVLVSLATSLSPSPVLNAPYTDNFKPESVDADGAGTVETRRKDEAGQSSVTVVRPSQQVRHPSPNYIIITRSTLYYLQSGTGISFTGTEVSAKEFECILIFDETDGVRNLLPLKVLPS